MALYRVIQWATGQVGGRALPAIINHPELELVGLWVHSSDKVGKDAGELAGLDPVGVVATDDVDDLIALKPDCVSYMSNTFDLSTICTFLRQGTNVVTTCEGMLTGTNFPKERMDAIDEAARQGASTFMATGFDPGYANLLAGFLTQTCRRVHSVTLQETLDCTTYPIADAWQGLGFGQPVKERISGPFTLDDVSVATPDVPGFFDTLDLVAGMLEVELERKDWIVERALTTKDIELGWMSLPKGTVAGQRRIYRGHARGRPVVQLVICWTMSWDSLDEQWEATEGYRLEIEGEPSVHATVVFAPPTREGLSDESDPMGVLLVGTAMAAVQAIPFVCDAAPGITNPSRLPVFGGRFTVV